MDQEQRGYIANLLHVKLLSLKGSDLAVRPQREALEQAIELITTGIVLTPAEDRALELTADLMTVFCELTGHASTRDDDLAEVIFHVHALQRMVMANATARAHPQLCRPLGGSVRG